MIATLDPDDAERRRQTALERLGSDDPSCAICGESDWRVLQRHHLPGRAYGDELIIACGNCHAKLSDAQLDHPAGPDAGEPPFLVKCARYLLGLAELAAQLVEQLRDHATALMIAAKRCPAPWGYLDSKSEDG